MAGNLRPYRGQARYRAVACAAILLRKHDLSAAATRRAFRRLLGGAIEPSAGIDRRRRFVVHDRPDRTLDGFPARPESHAWFRRRRPDVECGSRVDDAAVGWTVRYLPGARRRDRTPRS